VSFTSLTGGPNLVGGKTTKKAGGGGEQTIRASGDQGQGSAQGGGGRLGATAGNARGKHCFCGLSWELLVRGPQTPWAFDSPNWDEGSAHTTARDPGNRRGSGGHGAPHLPGRVFSGSYGPLTSLKTFGFRSRTAPKKKGLVSVRHPGDLFGRSGRYGPPILCRGELTDLPARGTHGGGTFGVDQPRG